LVYSVWVIRCEIAHSDAKEPRIPFVHKSSLFQHALRSSILGHREADNSGKPHVIEADSDSASRGFGCETPAPVGSIEQVEDLRFGRFLKNIEAALPDEISRRFVNDCPYPEAALFPMLYEIYDGAGGDVVRTILRIRSAWQISRHLWIGKRLAMTGDIFERELPQDQSICFAGQRRKQLHNAIAVRGSST